ncbi:MAG: DUF2796 domain-containing protein [Acidobacteria bacterium]|nr:DUF2796 domain-containing protein [Acidobacteriota bacterium]
MKIALILILSSSIVFPQGKSQKAHVHGAAQISIAMEGLKGEVEFEAPADGVIGFESEAKTPAQKKLVQDAITTLKSRGGELVIFPAASACKLTPKEVEVHREGPQHAEVHAHYDLICSKPISGEIKFGVTRLFPKTREVSVTFVSDQSQKSAKIVGDAGALKP